LSPSSRDDDDDRENPLGAREAQAAESVVSE